MSARVGFVAVALLGGLVACSSAPAKPGPSPAGSHVHAGAARLAQHSVRAHPPTVVPSPPPPPFGYCGGLETTSAARYVTSRGGAVALVQAEVDAAPTPIPHVSPVEQRNPLAHVRVLAGSLPDGPLSEIDSTPLRQRRYLLLVGDTGYGGYFTALGEYGTYAIHGHHAYRTCYDDSSGASHLVRRGITSVRGLTRLFARALG